MLFVPAVSFVRQPRESAARSAASQRVASQRAPRKSTPSELAPSELAPNELAARAPLPACIAFLASYGVPQRMLQDCAAYAKTVGVSAEEALIASGKISPDFYYRLLARRLGAPFLTQYVPLASTACRRHCSQSGIAPLAPNAAGLGYIIAPRGPAVERLLARIRPDAAAASDFAITTPTHLTRLALVSQSRSIAVEASQQLNATRTDLCAQAGASRAQTGAAACLTGAAAVGLAAAPYSTFLALCAVFALIFAAAVALRLWAFGASLVDRRPEPKPLSDTALPVYSVVLPVYRERNVVKKLVSAVAAIDYPGIMAQVPQDFEAVRA